MNMLRNEDKMLLLDQDRRVPSPSEVNLTATVLDMECRVLLLTAPSSGCGTTSSALSMARQLGIAARGRVLLVDASPSETGLSARLGMLADPGLFDLLLSPGGQLKLDDCVQRLPDQPFDLLPLGQPSHPHSPFSAESLQHLLDLLCKHYRFVVIDAAAVYGNNNALGLAALADGVVMVIRAEQTRWEVAQAAVERLRQARANLVGSVFNGRKYYLPQWLYKLL